MLIYTPRSGSTSILKYFSKLKPNYSCYNEPWFSWMQENLYKEVIDYQQVVSKENVFVKSTLKLLPVPIEQIMDDFDKVIFLLRKNKKDQIESAALVTKENGYLNYNKRKYWVESIDPLEYKQINERYEFLNETIIKASQDFNKPIYFYEDLYHGDFTQLFNDLELWYDEDAFNEFLDIKNKYRMVDNLETKKHKTLI
jgi:hypothetical protein